MVCSIATGELHSVREVCEIVFSSLGLNYEDYVIADPKFFRPSEDVPLVGDASKARKVLGWKPEKSFRGMIEEMAQYDFLEIQDGRDRGK